MQSLTRLARTSSTGKRTIAFWGDDEMFYRVKRRARLLKRFGTFTQSDVINVALHLFESKAEAKGTRWVSEQIQNWKGESGLATKTRTTRTIQPDVPIRGDSNGVAPEDRGKEALSPNSEGVA